LKPPRWIVKIGDGPDINVRGNVLDHEYTIGERRDKIAEVLKKWFRVADSYGVEISPGQNDALILNVTVAVDMMAHPDRQEWHGNSTPERRSDSRCQATQRMFSDRCCPSPTGPAGVS
jgi:hypothetical protein